MKRILPALLLLLGCLTGFTACEETEDYDPEYADWQARNAAYFAAQMDEARTAIAQAKAAYGESWEEHCNWRVYRCYSLSQDPAVAVKPTDSICVEIVERGAGTVSPLYTDSVYINFIGRLMPTDQHPEGYVFSHSSISEKPEDIFSDGLGYPAKFLVGGTVSGFTTALQYMHEGDRWRIWIPSDLGYGTSATTGIPAYSTLFYELQLKGIYPVGTTVPDWK